MIRNSKGLTFEGTILMICAVTMLAAFGIPFLNREMENARRTADIYTARNIESALSTVINGGDVTVSDHTGRNAVTGFRVIVTNTTDELQGSYAHRTCYAVADEGVSIDGEAHDFSWQYNQKLSEVLKDHGLDPASLCVSSDQADVMIDGVKGWDWYVVEYRYQVDQDAWTSEIYSGMWNESPSWVSHRTLSGMENMMHTDYRYDPLKQ